MPTRCGQCLSGDVDYSEDGSARCRVCRAVTSAGWARLVADSATEAVAPDQTVPLPAPAPPLAHRLVYPVWPRLPSSRSSLVHAAGVLGIVGGALLIAATPVTLLILDLLAPGILDFLSLFGLCGMCVHGVFGGFAVKFGMDALKGRAESGAAFMAAGVVGIVGALFLLGGPLGILAGILLLVAGALVYSG